MKDYFGNRRFVYGSLFLIFLLGLFLRTYRLDEILRFFYDQGRDALVVYDILQRGKLTLIGPTTGIEGIFLGPFYYYLITPAYFLGNGDPAVAATWVSFVNSLAIFVIFFTGRKLFGNVAGLISAFLFALSFESVMYSRWFSNPSTIPFFTSLMMLSLVYLADRDIKLGVRKIFGFVLAISLAISLQLEAAAAVWFVPTVLFFIWFLKIRLPWKWAVGAFLVFLLFSSAQIIFDLKHDFLISKAFYRFLITEQSFKASFIDTLFARAKLYFEIFDGYLLRESFKSYWALGVLFLASGYYLFKTNTYRRGLSVTLIWIFITLMFLVFYKGNNGYVWGYYLIGIVPALYMLTGFVLSRFLSNIFLFPLALIFLYFFTTWNWTIANGYLNHDPFGGDSLNLAVQKAAVDFVYQDAKSENFNVDVYVPPVIPVSYDYLFLWYGQNKYGFVPKKENEKLLYTIEEIDPPHPERLQAFIDRQNTFSKILGSHKIGGLTIEKRERF